MPPQPGAHMMSSVAPPSTARPPLHTPTGYRPHRRHRPPAPPCGWLLASPLPRRRAGVARRPSPLRFPGPQPGALQTRNDVRNVSPSFLLPVRLDSDFVSFPDLPVEVVRWSFDESVSLRDGSSEEGMFTKTTMRGGRKRSSVGNHSSNWFVAHCPRSRQVASLPTRRRSLICLRSTLLTSS